MSHSLQQFHPAAKAYNEGSVTAAGGMMAMELQPLFEEAEINFNPGRAPMRKLRLDPEKLAVEPFELELAVEAEGTVVGNFATKRQDSCNYPATCGGTSCDTGYPVCYQCTAHLC